MNCLPTSKCTEREFDTTKYIVSNCNVIEVTLTQKLKQFSDYNEIGQYDYQNTYFCNRQYD